MRCLCLFLFILSAISFGDDKEYKQSGAEEIIEKYHKEQIQRAKEITSKELATLSKYGRGAKRIFKNLYIMKTETLRAIAFLRACDSEMTEISNKLIDSLGIEDIIKSDYVHVSKKNYLFVLVMDGLVRQEIDSYEWGASDALITLTEREKSSLCRDAQSLASEVLAKSP